MIASYTSLRAISEASSPEEAETILETVQILNEVYYGKKPVEPIRKAMADLVEYIHTNPDGPFGPKLTQIKALEVACCNVFGFKSMSIYLGQPYNMTSRAFMCTSVKLLPNPKDVVTHQWTKKHENGYYDTNHKLHVIVDMSAAIILRCKCTVDECVALLLHEIGHNFDHTILSIIHDWVDLGVSNVKLYKKVVKKWREAGKFYVDYIQNHGPTAPNRIPFSIVHDKPPKNKDEAKARRKADKEQAKDTRSMFRTFDRKKVTDYETMEKIARGKAVTANVGDLITTAALNTELGREFLNFLNNAENAIVNIIPPINSLYQMLSRLGWNVKTLISRLTSIAECPLAIGARIMSLLTPKGIAQTGMDFMARKKEIFADTIATAYGYGPELATGLDKLLEFTTESEINLGAATSFITDYLALMHEIYSMLFDDHPSNQQRIRSCIDMLERDLAKPDIKPEDKAALSAELDRLKETYEAVTVNFDEDERLFLTRFNRQCMDAWAESKPHKLIDKVLAPINRTAYAQ